MNISFLNTKDRRLKALIFLVAVVVITFFLPRPDEQKYKYELGHPWSYPALLAKYDFEVYNSDDRKAQLIDSIDKNFIPIYHISNQPIADIKNLLTGADITASERYKIERAVNKIYKTGVIDPEKYSEMGLKYNPEKIVIEEDNSKRIQPVEDLFTPQTAATELSNEFVDDTAIREIITNEGLTSLLSPNFIPDVEGTKQQYETVLKSIDGVIRNIQKDEMLIDRGMIVDSQRFNVLKAYEAEGERHNPSKFISTSKITAGQALLAILLISGLYVFLYIFRRDDFDKISRLLCLVSLIVSFFIFAVIMSVRFTSGLYIVPFAILPILVVVFYDSMTALFCLVLETVLCGVFASLSYEFVAIQLAAGITAIFSTGELTKRGQLLRTAFFVFLAYIVSYVAIELIQIASLNTFSWKLIGFFAINMVLTSFAYILIFVVEKVFGMTSMVTLIELSNTNNPLLRELYDKCPGTFQHSMAVGNLAESGARKIGANTQIVRTGALYHDIGKLSNPAFFTENQHGVNPHDELTPEQSAGIIIRHVTDGLKSADKKKLPAVIKDMISQHHGRSTTRYFYNTYCNAHPDEEVDQTPFTYPGPNPQSKEASLLMMADAVEAASRSLQKHDTESITNLVNKLIDTQVAEGLHKESPISFRDIALIKQAFIDRLRTMYHVRIAYPDKKSKQKQQ